MQTYKQLIRTCKHCYNKTAHDFIGICGNIHIAPEEIIDRIILDGNSHVCSGPVWILVQCITCKQPSLLEQEMRWRDRPSSTEMNSTLAAKYNKMIDESEFNVKFPINANVSMPSIDMPTDVAADYIEARSIFEASPRSSAALLRLALQKLCKHLGQPGKNINEDIRSLVKAGLSTEVEQVLDTIRIVGNNAVHPGTLNLSENPDMVEALFDLINFIVEEMITRPRLRKELYNRLPKKGA